MRLLITLFILLFSVATIAASTCTDNYLNLQNRLEKLKVKNDFGTEIKISELEVSANTIKALDENGKYVVFLDYEVDADKFIVGLIDVPLYKGQGIASEVYKYVLDFHPNIKSIEGLLASDNELAFMFAKKRGFSNIEALMETPAYKLRAKFGFTKIDMKRTMIRFKDDGDVSFIKLVQEKDL